MLTAALDSAAGGAGRLVAITGAAGIGKSRLLAAAGSTAAQRGFGVFSARCSELEGDIAFGLVRQIFEPHLIRMPRAERDRCLDGAAGYAAAAVLSDTGSAGTASGDFAILHGLFWLTANLCERGPIALIMDDLHWADTASLRFLAYVLPRLSSVPVAVLIAHRPVEPHHLLGQIVTDAESTVLRPAPLSEAASRRLVRSVLDGDAEDAFLRACHTATRGNPLLLRDLAATFKAEGMVPAADSVARVDVLGPRAVAQRIALWLRRLPGECTVLAEAVSVLGDGTALQTAAALARIPTEAALRAARSLEQAELFHPVPAGGLPDGVQRLQFCHPLVRATVYEGIDPAARVEAHRRAAALLTAARHRAERVATHVLRLPPAQDGQVVTVLRQAAAEAFAHGSPDSAATYLRRCLAEPPPAEVHAEVQWELGRTMTLVDTRLAADDLRAALALATSPRRRARIAVLLSTALIYLLGFEEAERVCLSALAELAPAEAGLRGRLEANLLLIPILHPGRPDLAGRRRAAGPRGRSGGALDCLLAAHRALHGDPEAVGLALDGLRGAGVLDQVYPETIAAQVGWIVLIHADRDEAISSIDAAIARAHRHGSVNGLATAHVLRGLAWLQRGQLAEAEADIRAGLRSADSARMELAALLGHCFLADVLVEQGRLDEAEATLDALGVPDPAPFFGPLFWYLDSRAKLLRQRGKVEQARQTALASGQRLAMHDAHEVASLSPWRLEAATCAHLLGLDEQVKLADEELRNARHWGAPRALGCALRVQGLVLGPREGIEHAREAVEVLERSPARLEYARALLDYGSALRRTGRAADARDPLQRALDIATAAGAVPLRERVRAELRAAGVRPRRTGATGPAALTPSERRVAELAIAGRTNRRIAEDLFITVKTVEVHLTSAYRKLGIHNRDRLASVLPAARP